MSLRIHAVIVQPDQWSGAPAELARLLAPITGSEIGPLAAALNRGPMTVEADLSAADAEALARRLTTLGVPTEIEPPTKDKPPAFDVPRERVTDEVPRKRSSTVVGHKPMASEAAQNAGGWGALFPDLAEPAAPAAPPSLDELEGPAPQTPSRKRVTTAPLVLGGVEVTPPPQAPDGANDFDADDFADVNLADFDFDDFDLDDVEIVPPHQVEPTKQPASTGRAKPANFDATKMHGLLPEPDENAAPYRPTGFDPRPEHHPPFAAMFAVLAPGAGHVFNGDDDEAMKVATRFWMIFPWVKSVRESSGRAEKIRTYWAPRPEDGSGIRAFRWVGGFWLILGLGGFMLSYIVPMVIDLTERKPEVPTAVMTSRRVEAGVRSAKTGVLAARVQGLDAVAEATKDIVPDQQFTMTPRERSERLFALAVPECRRRNYSMCEAMMKRVLVLRPAYSAAIKLQAWASVSMNGRKEPMPDVGQIQTLSELELSKIRQEMALDGEDVPAPPEPTGAPETAPPLDGPNAGSLAEPKPEAPLKEAPE